MWTIAGVLLGLVVLASLLGFHAGPHMHVMAGILGVFAAAWLLALAVTGRSGPGLWVLFSADLVISAGVGTLAWKGLTADKAGPPGRHPLRLEGAEGVAVTDLIPAGVVRVLGEQWSAVAANGTAPAGAAVQVLRVSGVRLEVWIEETTAAVTAPSLPRSQRDPAADATDQELRSADRDGSVHEGYQS